MTSRSINWNCSIKRKMNRLNNTTIFVNECTPKLENIKQSYDWRLECPLFRFTPALVGKLITRFSFDFPTLTHVSKEWILGEFIHMTRFGMTEKEKSWHLGNINAKHLWFAFNLTVQSRFVLERKVIYATLDVFFGRISFLK